MVDTHTATAGTHYWTDPDAWTHVDAGHIPEDGDAVAIPSGAIIYFDADLSGWATGINGIVVTSTGELHFATGDNIINALHPTAYPNGATRPFLYMKDATNISGTGKLYIGDSTGTVIPRPTAAAAYAPNATISLGTTGAFTVTGGFYTFGWIPTTPAYTFDANGSVVAGPAFSTIGTYTDTSHFTLSNSLDIQQGEQVAVSALTPTGPNADKPSLYTVSSNVADAITLTGAMAAPVRAAGDYVAIMSRPIQIVRRGVFNAAVLCAGTVTSTQQGAMYNNISGPNTNGVTVTGCSWNGPGTALGAVSASVNTTFTNCAANNIFYAFNGGTNVRTNGVIIINTWGGYYFANGSHFTGYASVNANSTYGFNNGGVGVRLIKCVVTGTINGASCGGGDVVHVNTTIKNGAITDTRSGYEYKNCSFGAGVPAAYQNPLRAPWSLLQAYNHENVTGVRALWGRGGIGTTNQATVVYGTDTYGTMKFTVDGTYTNTPLIWDTEFWMPANKSLTFTVPMYKAAADTGITAEVWVYDPFNDPLWTDPLWTLTPSVGTTQGSPTATYVVARAAMPDTTDAWQDVTITVPAFTSARKLVARIIVKGTTVSKNCYAYLNYMEAALLKHKSTFK